MKKYSNQNIDKSPGKFPGSALRKYLLLPALALLWLSSCKKGLDYANSGTINPADVWQDSTMIGAFLTDIYGGLMPGWNFNGDASDEGIFTPKSLSTYSRGIITVDNANVGLSYTYIDKVNYFLDQIQNVSPSIISAGLKNQYTGEAKFWRAWTYWSMVQNVGGIPLILHTQDYNNPPSLFVTRNKTSECMTQIIQDLDSAILLLPGVYTNAQTDYGRITKVAAMAFKGRVLLWYASPLFNPTNDASRWQAAYTANQDAVNYAQSQGASLYPSFRELFYVKRNPEIIMVNQFFYPQHADNFNTIRPEPLTENASNGNQPLLPLLLAFPRRDGSPLPFDTTQLSNPVYNAQFLNDFYTNRDDRFYSTIFVGGTPYPAPDQYPPIYVQGDGFWNVWQWNTSSNSFTNLLSTIHPGMPGNPGCTGFFDRKGLDTTVTAGLGGQAQIDWPEIRFAEVLMNYGECANEAGQQAAALQVLQQIRARAGIAAGNSGNYGITATSQSDIRAAYITERQVEFAFENKRLPDLRRWKRYDIINNEGARHGLYITLNTGATVVPSENIMNAGTRAKFTANYISNLDGDPTFYFNFDLNHWFYPLAPSQITQSQNKLAQNLEWGGSFDPLQ